MIDSITYSVITQSFTALYSKDLKVKALADICNIDVLKDFAKFTGNHLYQILYLMKLQATSLQLYCKRDPRTDVFL